MNFQSLSGLLLIFSFSITIVEAKSDSYSGHTRMLEMRDVYLKAGGSVKAFEQLSCFLRTHEKSQFRTKPVSGNLRCDKISLSIKNKKTLTLIDYTKASNQPRMYIFDLEKLNIKVLAVSHGRYGETHRSNQTIQMKPRANSVLKAIHFSNENGKNASVGGFFMTGNEYPGAYGRSLVLHGLEKNVNDNSCARAVVIHQNRLVTNRAANIMSSGCPMVSDSRIDEVVSSLKNGSLLYIYTPAEAALAPTSCGRDLWLAPNPMK